MREIPLESVLDGVKPYTSRQMEGKLEPVVDKDSLKPYEVRTYQLPGVGLITHFVSNASINGRTDGPNDMFGQLQKLDLGLRRYPLGSAQGEHASDKARAEPAKATLAKAKPATPKRVNIKRVRAKLVKAKPAQLRKLNHHHLNANIALVVFLIFSFQATQGRTMLTIHIVKGTLTCHFAVNYVSHENSKLRDRLLT
jgi:hypothetical protein